MKLFDLHCDTATECEKLNYSMQSNPLHWDFSRISTLSESSRQITAVYIPDETTEKDAWSYALRVFSFIRSQNIPLISTADDLRFVPHGILLAVENGKLIGNDLSKLSHPSMHDVVYITLTWNGINRIGNGALSGKKDGLTPFGCEAVREMIRLGILPDVSHLNERGFWDVAELSEGYSLLASHSNSYTIHQHPRNVTDLQFTAIRDSGGLLGVNLCDAHLGKHSFGQLERHIDHFWSLGGEETVALGMDLDGTPIPSEWGGVEVACRLYEYFLMKGYPQELIDKLFFENSYSFFMKTLTRRKKCIRIGT